MTRRLYIIVSTKRTLILASACFLGCLALIIFFTNSMSHNQPVVKNQQNSDYTILAANDLGMHCYQNNYSSFLILPPGNNIKVQVFRKGTKEAKLINSGIKVSYKIIDNTVSADKTNFWQYAKDYGYDVAPNIGITGNGLSGIMKLSDDKKYYVATAIPVTPYNDGSNKVNPYQLAEITINDERTDAVLARIDNLVVPVSDEMDCSNCHGKTDTDLNVLKAHDELSNTTLVADLEKGKRYKCSNCHQDNILGGKGQRGVLPLSQAMHGFHANKMQESSVKPECYNCHPGEITKCYRGVMYANSISCVNDKCHGDMAKVAKSISAGRQPWLQEPNCSNCHGEKYSVNAGQLYHNSYLKNNSNEEMNNFIMCISCHNGPHAEWKSTVDKDNLLPINLLGYPDYINKCTVCHEGIGKIHETIVP